MFTCNQIIIYSVLQFIIYCCLLFQIRLVVAEFGCFDVVCLLVFSFVDLVGFEVTFPLPFVVFC